MFIHDWEVILSVHNKAPALTEEVTGAELFLDRPNVRDGDSGGAVEPGAARVATKSLVTGSPRDVESALLKILRAAGVARIVAFSEGVRHLHIGLHGLKQGEQELRILDRVPLHLRPRLSGHVGVFRRALNGESHRVHVDLLVPQQALGNVVQLPG